MYRSGDINLSQRDLGIKIAHAARLKCALGEEHVGIFLRGTMARVIRKIHEQYHHANRTSHLPPWHVDKPHAPDGPACACVAFLKARSRVGKTDSPQVLLKRHWILRAL